METSKLNEIKVLYVITGLRLGGAETQLFLLAKNLIRRGVNVHVIVLEKDGVLVGKFIGSGISVTELGIKSISDIWNGFHKFCKVCDEFRPDIVHSHMIHANILVRLYKLFNNVPKLVSTAHNIKEGSKLLMLGYRLTDHLASWSTNVSKEAYDHFVKHRYFKIKRSSFIPNAIDTEVFSGKIRSSSFLSNIGIPHDGFIFLAAGRLHSQKNYPMLLRAFHSIYRDLPNGYLLIAGEGELRSDLIALSSELQISDRIRFLGLIDDMSTLMASCDCFVLTSDYEGFGLVIGEAMSSLKPVIATDCGGVKEVMSNFGTLVKKGDSKLFGKAMLNIYRNGVAYDLLLNARNHIIRNYSVDKVIDQWLSLYSK